MANSSCSTAVASVGVAAVDIIAAAFACGCPAKDLGGRVASLRFRSTGRNCLLFVAMAAHRKAVSPFNTGSVAQVLGTCSASGRSTSPGAISIENTPALTNSWLSWRRSSPDKLKWKRVTLFQFNTVLPRLANLWCSVFSNKQNRATATTAIDVALNVLGGVREGTGPVDTLRKSPPSVLRKLCEKMGATYIKVRVRVWDRF